MTEDDSKTSYRPVVLCILDGWGHREAREDNAILMARTPNWDRLCRTCPQSLIETSGVAVGLPDGQMGNSEVGHMNIGAGRVVLQDLPRIDEAIEQDRLGDLPALRRLAEKAGRVHLMGLLSPGGVHSHQDHMIALARALAANGVEVLVHGILDGRDTPPKSARGFIETFEAALPEGVRLATVMGRYWAMDRDKRWDRVKLAFDAIVDAGVADFADAQTALADAYEAGETDEFVKPRRIGGYDGVRAGDGLLMANFRADRAREILTALLDPHFDGFDRSRMPDFAAAAGMVEYSEALNPFLETLFPSENLEDTLGEVVAKAGRTQLRIAETEKYAHVTFFLNGGQETCYEGEDRIMVQSPDVATYDLKPEMSAAEVTDRLVERIGDGRTDLIVVNFANPDMVGHTGVVAAAVKAVEAIDACLGRVAEAVEAAGGAMLITADHGNLEMMADPETGQPHTAHTTNPVPLTLVGGPAGVALKDGRLADLAPTVLKLMDLAQPAAMSGRVLLAPAAAAEERTRRAIA
ncbi:MAG: phosphoglycerate mutase (2,3-diphosphoglycerate-independent) [Rhizobiales bacterium NRL2]|jgi:2,3-bisphosphoglycerate-independent phosphoglycerate mutase|nr:MAG: phosphoglycerate mutase (2,3-diphosphoglycerate-independent) [Rhizobiales bacterium NRL2]